jgi:integration host factor subunit beta
MVKKELVDSLVHAVPGITKKDMKLVVDGLFESIADALARNESVDIRGFGRMTLKTRRPRQARNPKTGVYVDLPERRVIHFKPSPRLNRLVNSESAIETTGETLPESVPGEGSHT